MTTASRIRLRRAKGWRMPPNTVSVARPSKWGNPFKVGDEHPEHGGPITPMEAVRLYRDRLLHLALFERTPPIDDLRGKNLACWCALDAPCHANVLLRLANA